MSNVFDLAARASSQSAAAQAAAKAAYNFTIELWTFYAVGVAFTLLRTYARGRAVGLRNLKADDYLVWFAIVRLPPVDITQHYHLHFLLNANSIRAVILHSADGTRVQSGQCCPWLRKQWHDGRPAGCAVPTQPGVPNEVCLIPSQLNTDERHLDAIINCFTRVIGSKIQVAGWTTYSTLIGSLKLSMLAFYIRLMVCKHSTTRRPPPRHSDLVTDAPNRRALAGVIAFPFTLGLSLSSQPLSRVW